MQWSKELVCYVVRLTYNYDTRCGRIYLEGYCDMSACIALFERIDPNVRRISTYASNKRDTSYHRGTEARWYATLSEGSS